MKQPLLASILPHPRLRQVFADAAHVGDKLAAALAPLSNWTIEIIRRFEASGGFQLLKRRVVERPLAWLNRNRRFVKDLEASIESAVAWLLITSIKLLTRRFAGA
jgi:transposase